MSLARLVLPVALFLAASPAWAALSVVQTSPVANAATATSVTATYGVATTANNLLVCVAVVNNSGGCCSPITFADNAAGGSNVYTLLTQLAPSPNAIASVAYVANAKSVTTVTATAFASSANLTIACTEVGGAATTTVLDASGQDTGSFANPPTTPTVTTTFAPDILIGVATVGNIACTLSTNTTGFTTAAVQSATASLNGIVLAYNIVGATGGYAYAANASCAGLNAIGMQLAAFKQAGAAAPSGKPVGGMSMMGVGF